jgi:PKD repeat protein
MSTVNSYVNGTNGVSTNITITVVEAGEMAANFSTNPSATGMLTQAVHINEGETVTFTDLSTGADHIAWSFEGGSPATSTESVVAVTYNTAGSYTTTLTAYNEDESNSSEFTLTVTVTVSGEEAVTADFTTDPEATDVYITTYISINQGETVTFTNASSENTDHIAWTFDGGSPATSTENVVTVTYAEAGNFTATLTAYNDDETISDSKSVTVMVTSVDPNAVEASFTTNPEYTDLYVYRMLTI